MNPRRWRKHYRWIAPLIVTVTPVALPPIAPGCDTYGPACVIDTTGTWPGDVPTVETTGDNPEPLNP
jgi:hypothetical protein